MAALVALVSLCTYYSTSSENPVTGEKQRVGGITPKQEIAFGLRSAPQMAAEFGGLDPDRAKQEAVKQMGRAIVAKSDARKSEYSFDFHVLDDARTEVTRLTNIAADPTCRNTVVILVVGGGEGTTSGLTNASLGPAAAPFLNVNGNRVPVYVVAIAPPASDVAGLRSIATASGGQ